jgi:hypothetical protein
LAIVVDDPVRRAAPAPADIIIGRPDRPSSIAAPNRKSRKRNRRRRRRRPHHRIVRPAAAAPPSRLEQVGRHRAAPIRARVKGDEAG